MTKRGVVVLGVVLAACGGSEPVAERDTVGRRTVIDRAAGDGTGTGAGTPGAPGAIGDACTAGEDPAASTCSEGLMCFGSPGGYCAAMTFAAEPCPEGAVRAQSIRAGELCLKACESDADCRRDEGYLCDTTWHACTPPRLLAPSVPHCEPLTTALRRRTFGGSAQLTTSNGPGRYHHEVSAVVAGPGRIVGMHIAGGRLAEPNPLGVVAFREEEAVISDRPFTSPRQNHFDPWTAVDRQGQVYAVWLGFDGGRAPERSMQIGFSTTMDAEQWTPPAIAHDPNDCGNDETGCMDKPMIAVGPDPADPTRDLVHVFYYQNNREELRYRRSLDRGQTWEPSIRAPGGAFGDVFVSANGHVHLVTMEVGPGNGPPNMVGDVRIGAMYTRSEDGGRTWRNAVRVSLPQEPAPFFFSNPQVVADAARNRIFVAYPAGTPDAVWDIMLAFSPDGGTTWQRWRANDDATCANHQTPVMALDTDGRAHLMWRENRGNVGRVVYTSCGHDGRCAPNEALSDAPFASYALVRHATMWMGEYDSLLIDVARRTITAIWTQPVMESGVATSRIFFATGRLPRGRGARR